MRQTFLLAALLLSACRQDRPPAPTTEESTELNDADAMLNDLANSEGR